MPKLPLYALTALMAAGLAAPGALADASHPVTFAPGSRIWLEGNSTLHRFASKANRFEITAAVAGKQLDSASLAGLHVNVPVRALKSGEGALDDNLVKALKGDRFNAIRFDARRFESKPLGGGKYAVDATGTLVIAGAQRDVTVHAIATTTGQALHVMGTKELKMTDFGIAPPVLLGGMIRCSDEIVVHYDLTATLPQ